MAGIVWRILAVGDSCDDAVAVCGVVPDASFAEEFFPGWCRRWRDGSRRAREFGVGESGESASASTYTMRYSAVVGSGTVPGPGRVAQA